MYNEERYQVKYFILMLEPIRKGLIGIKENMSFSKLERELEKDLLTYFSECKTHYPKSTFLINYKIVKKKRDFYQPKTMPVEVYH